MNHSKLVKRLLTPYDLSHEKIRIGSENDGGYVISKTFLDSYTDYVYSLGIGYDCNFDLELANRGYKIYQYDGSVPNTPIQHENFVFQSIMMNNQLLEEEIIKNNHENSNLLLKMDIEGDEYGLLYNLDSEILNRFSQIVFEMHSVIYFAQLVQFLEKINSQFVLIHIHANNSDPRIYDCVPNVLELTFVNKNLALKKLKDACPIIGLDIPNFTVNPEIILDWWIK